MLNISIEKQSKSFINNFRKSCKALAKQGNVLALKKLLQYDELNYKRHCKQALLDTPQNTFILSMIERAKFNKLHKVTVTHNVITVPCCVNCITNKIHNC